MFKSLIFVAFMFLFVGPIHGDEKWKWYDGKASIMHYFMNASSNYQTHLVRRSMADWREIEVRISNGKETLFKWKTHGQGAFVFSESIVIYARFNTMSSGCELRAYDLDKQKEIWRKRLRGLGPIRHSKYRNRINMEIRKDKVVVYGNESAGQYIEVLKVKTGEFVSNTIGTKQYKRFTGRE